MIYYILFENNKPIGAGHYQENYNNFNDNEFECSKEQFEKWADCELIDGEIHLNDSGKTDEFEKQKIIDIFNYERSHYLSRYDAELNKQNRLLRLGGDAKSINAYIEKLDAYAQSLCDLSKQKDFPLNIVYPDFPRAE